MTNDALSTHYRNLLIATARQCKASRDKSVLLRREAGNEPEPGRKSGLYCLARAHNKHALSLRSLLHRNSFVLRRFFKTTDIETVAKKEILLTRKRGASTVAPAQNKNNTTKP